VADTAKVDATAYIGPEARVLGSAQVAGQARVLDHAVIAGAAVVSDQAEVSGHSIVKGEAKIRDAARVRGHAFVGGRVQLRERARVADLVDLQEHIEISGDACVRGISAPLDGSKASGHAILDADYAMAFQLADGVHFHHIPWGGWYFDEVAAKLTKPRGLVASYAFRETEGAQAMDEFGALVAPIRGAPERRTGELKMDGKGQYLCLDPSLTDAPAATWIVHARLPDAKAQPLFSINSPAEGGVVMGVNAQGCLMASLSVSGEAPVLFASKARLRMDAPLSLSLRVDGSTASLFINGRRFATKPWPHSAQAWFRDVGNPSPTSIYLGRDAKGVSSRCVLAGFKAFNVALSNEEMALPQFGGVPDV
jgi:hypothetical protein